jgi:quinol monooxygenase YgiN
MIDRRIVLGAGLGLCVTSVPASAQESAMYGLFGKMIAKPGERDALIAILRESTGEMPGCRIYVLATDPADANAIWISEVWDTKDDHDASLRLPQVQAAIGRARPLIEGFGERFETTPIGGVGLDG